MKIVKKLKGHSSCTLFLESHDNKLYVRKTSSKDYRKRLIEQYIKQDNFSDPIIKKPEIISGSFSQDDSEFVMGYIDAPTFSEYVSSNTLEDILPKFRIILNWIKSNNILDIAETSNIFDKLHCMNKTELKTKFINNSISTSYCHGDLTFENILIKNDDIYFIDFLDSSINCQEMDIAKLLQDILCGWSWRDSRIPISKCALLYDEIVSAFPNQITASRNLLLMNLYRILPYANDKTRLWVNERIENLEKLK